MKVRQDNGQEDKNQQPPSFSFATIDRVISLSLSFARFSSFRFKIRSFFISIPDIRFVSFHVSLFASCFSPSFPFFPSLPLPLLLFPSSLLSSFWNLNLDNPFSVRETRSAFVFRFDHVHRDPMPASSSSDLNTLKSCLSSLREAKKLPCNLCRNDVHEQLVERSFQIQLTCSFCRSIFVSALFATHWQSHSILSVCFLEPSFLHVYGFLTALSFSLSLVSSLLVSFLLLACPFFLFLRSH